MKQRPNFYIVLELDPAENNMSEIQAAIKKKRGVWSTQKSQGTPAVKRKAERYLKLIPEMELLLAEPEARKKEAKAAIQERKKETQKQWKELDVLIDMQHPKPATRNDIDSLYRQTKKVFSKKEIEDRLVSRGVALKKETSKARSKNSGKLETSVANNISNALGNLALKNLYDFLNLDYSPTLGRRASPRSLCDRADQIYKELHATGRTDPDTSLKMELTGQAKSVFKNEKQKEQYDNTLAADVFKSLEGRLTYAGRDNFISKLDLEKLIDAAKEKGISKDVALDYISGYALNKKWEVYLDTEAEEVFRLVCGYCDTLSKSSKEDKCHACGMALIEPCPNCGNPTPTENSACGACGYRTGDAHLVKTLYESGKRALSNGQIEEAGSNFRRALEYWADWQPVVVELEKLASKKQERDDEVDKVSLLLRSRKLEEADLLLQRFIKKFGQSQIACLKEKIENGLRRAKRSFDNAEKLRLEGKHKQAFNAYEEVLSFCVDHHLTLAVMTNNPPLPPHRLTAQRTNSGIRLTWPESDDGGRLNYRLLRKIECSPVHETDGEIIAETRNTSMDDVSVKSGIAYYYAIFCERSGVFSNKHSSSGPHIKFSDIDNVEFQASDGQVLLNWRQPKGCQSVEIWRKEGLAPTARGEGKKLTPSGSSYVDSGLSNGQRYGYLVVAKFSVSDRSSGASYSKGVGITVTPVAPPDPVEDLRINRKGRTIYLDWTPPPVSAHDIQVQLRQTQSKPELSKGQILSLQRVGQIGKPVVALRPGNAQTTVETQGRVFYIPFTIKSQTAVVGEFVEVTTIDDVSSLKAQKNGRSIILTWRWPAGAREVLIAYQYSGYPQSPNANGAQERVTIEEYTQNDSWELKSAANKKHYFTVFVRDSIADLYSSGMSIAETMGQEATVGYRIVLRKKLFGKSIKMAWVEFTSDISETLRDLQVVLKANYPPVSKDDGIVIAETAQLVFSNGRARIEIPEKYTNSRGYIKVFFKDFRFAKEFRLLAPKKEELRIR